MLQSQRWSSRSGRSEVRRHRVAGGRAMVGRTGARAEKSNVSTTARAAGLHTEAGREAAAVRNTRHPGPDGGNGSSFGSRTYLRGRSAAGTVRLPARPQCTGRGETRPHAELLKSVARRVVDGAMLHLIKMWLEAPVEETDERGNKHRSTRNRDEGRGIPQGSPISPLLSNLYMRRFVLGWKKLGHEKRLKAYIINY